jgi:hypothetical protein
MRRQYSTILTTVLLLALAVGPSAVRSDPSSPSVAVDGSSATTVSGSPAPALKLLGRWHGGPVYSSAVSGDHVYFGTGGSLTTPSGSLSSSFPDGTPRWRVGEPQGGSYARVRT